MPSIRPSSAHRAGRPLGLSCALYAEGPGVASVTLGGELDLASAPQLDRALTDVAARSDAVILDLRELTFMDSSGLHVILTGRARLADAGCRLVIVPGGHQVQRIFEVTGVDRLVEFVTHPMTLGLATAG